MNGRKVKTGIALTEDCLKMMDDNLDVCKCRSRNVLAEKAIREYIVHTQSKHVSQELAMIFNSLTNDSVAHMENRMASMLYKIAVELAQVNLMLADTYEFDAKQIHKLRGTAVELVNDHHGFINLKKANETNLEV